MLSVKLWSEIGFYEAFKGWEIKTNIGFLLLVWGFFCSFVLFGVFLCFFWVCLVLFGFGGVGFGFWFGLVWLKFINKLMILWLCRPVLIKVQTLRICTFLKLNLFSLRGLHINPRMHIMSKELKESRTCLQRSESLLQSTF